MHAEVADGEDGRERRLDRGRQGGHTVVRVGRLLGNPGNQPAQGWRSKDWG